MNFDIADRHFRIRQEFDIPIVAGNLVFFGRFAFARQAEYLRRAVELRHTIAQGTARVVEDQVQNGA